MPPAAKPLAVQPLPQGRLVLKKQARHGSLRFVVYMLSDTHKYAPCWLSHEPHERLSEILNAFADITKADIQDEFMDALLISAHS